MLKALAGQAHKPVEVPEGSDPEAVKRIKFNQPAFSPAEYPPGKSRAKANVLQVHLAVLDLDKCSQIALQVALQTLQAQGLRFGCYTSFSHRRPEYPTSPVRARVIIDLDKPVAGPQWLDFWSRLVQWFQTLTDVQVDGSCKDSSRLYGLPYTPHPDESSTIFSDGAPLSVDAVLALPPLEELSRALVADTYGDSGEVDLAETPLEIHKRRERAQRYLRRMAPAVEGERGDDQTLKAAHTGAGFGLTPDQFWPLLLQYNARCRPPWDPAELRVKLENATKYNTRPFGYLLDKGLPPTETPPASPESPDTPSEEPGDIVMSSNNEGDLAQDYLRRHGASQGHLVSLGSELFTYHESTGSWTHKGETRLRGEVLKAYHDARIYTDDGDLNVLKMTKSKMCAVADLVLHDLDILEEGFLTKPPAGIAFRDRFVYAGPGGVQFRPHAPANRATWCVDLDMDPAADPGPWPEILRNVFWRDPDAADKIAVLQQWVGAALLGIAPQYARVPILLGPGGAGKSTVMEVVEGLLPAAVRASVKPHDWGGEYSRGSLQGVRLNSVGEIPERDILAGDYFKQIVTGETTTARHPYGRPFEFTPQAGHVFSCNTLPGTLDNSTGFWRRVLVIQFNRSFTSGGAPAAGTKDDYVKQALEHAPGIYAWALRGADTLIKEGRYKLPASHKKALGEWRRGSDSVVDFVESCCEIGARTPKGLLVVTGLGQIHKAFRQWAHVSGRRTLGTRSLGSRLKQVEGLQEVTKNGRGATFLVKVLNEAEWEDYAKNTL